MIGILLELEKVNKLLKSLINEEISDKRLMAAIRGVSSWCSLMTRDSKNLHYLGKSEDQLFGSSDRNLFLLDLIANGVKIKQLQLVLGVAAGSCIHPQGQPNSN